jgi:hypothetical protein
MNSLEKSLEKLNNDLSNDFDRTKSVFEEAVINHCSDHTKRQLFNKGLNKSISYFVSFIQQNGPGELGPSGN